MQDSLHSPHILPITDRPPEYVQTAYVATRLRPGTYIVLCFAGRPGSDAPTIHGRTAVVR